MVNQDYKAVHEEVMALASDRVKSIDALNLYRQFHDLYETDEGLEGKREIIREIMNKRGLADPSLFVITDNLSPHSIRNCSLDVLYEVLQMNFSSFRGVGAPKID